LGHLLRRRINNGASSMALIFALLSLFVLVQSIYGVGLLVFGTPVLLLAGMPFDHVLGLLLPSSILISTQQLFTLRLQEMHEKRFLWIPIVGIPVGILISLQLSSSTQISIILGLAMIFVAIMRSNEKTLKWVGKLFSKHRRLFHLTNAIFHGYSNLGGTFLSVYSVAIYHDKLQVLRCTALFYLIYGIAQIIVLLAFGKFELFINGLLFLPATILIHNFVGQRSFRAISQPAFHRLATVFFWCIGIVLLFRNLNIKSVSQTVMGFI